ncbi:MAG: hypothetical protein IPP94_02040 [Ignavibacteria bacterium]|nr:hypothetical protein [Ignavibacteria bacterium]
MFNVLVVDAQYLAPAALRAMIGLASRGARIVLRRDTRCPGRFAETAYASLLRKLRSFPTVANTMSALTLPMPLLTGEDIPEYWARASQTGISIFFANPASRTVKYPMPYDGAGALPAVERVVRVHAAGRSQKVTLRFENNQSLLLEVGTDGTLRFVDIAYAPEER